MKVVITEEQFKRVILKEQSVRCDQWKNGTFQNGDGITTPKITITKSPTQIVGLYEGRDNGGCIQRSTPNYFDTPHQLAGITVFYEAAPYLKELYKKGVYVTIGKITMERDRDEMFKITIPLVSTTEDKAITNINERGGMGNHTGSGPYKVMVGDIENDTSNKLIGKQTVSAGDITENFLYWRNISQFPIQTTSSSPQSTTQPQSTDENKKTIRHNGNVEELKAGLKKLWDDGHTGVLGVLNHDSPPYSYVSITLDPSQQKKYSMSYIYSNKNEGDDTLQKVYDKVKATNLSDTPIIDEYRYDMNPQYDNNGKLIKGHEGYIVWFDRTKG